MELIETHTSEDADLLRLIRKGVSVAQAGDAPDLAAAIYLTIIADRAPDQRDEAIRPLMEAARALLDRVEGYGFKCEAGPLSMCQEWLDLKELVKWR